MIKIPDKHYAGYRYRDREVLGFLTPYGTDAAAKKRMATVDSWRDRKTDLLSSEVLDNELQEGFLVVQNVQRYMTSNQVWRIQDPRGFELEITSANMSTLISDTTIKNGYIEGKCIWARLGKDNVLVHEDSEEYKTAIANNERTAKKVSIRDVNLGDTILLHDGREVEYLGSFHVMYRLGEESVYDDQDSGRYRYITVGHTVNPLDFRKVYIIKHETPDKDVLDGAEPYTYKLTPSLKVSAVVNSPAKPRTKADVLQEVRDHVMHDDFSIQHSDYFSHRKYNKDGENIQFITNEYTKKNLAFGWDEVDEREMSIMVQMNPYIHKYRTKDRWEEYHDHERKQHYVLAAMLIEHEGQLYAPLSEVNGAYSCARVEIDENTGVVTIPEHPKRISHFRANNGYYNSYSYGRRSPIEGLPSYDDVTVFPNVATKYFLFNASVAGDKIPYRMGDVDD